MSASGAALEVMLFTFLFSIKTPTKAFHSGPTQPGGPGGPCPLHFSAEQNIYGTKTKFFENVSRKAFSCVLENQNMKFSSPASTMEAPPGDIKYSTILALTLKIDAWALLLDTD